MKQKFFAPHTGEITCAAATNMNLEVNAMNKYFTQDGLPTFFLWFECKYLGQPNIFGDVAFDNCYDKKLPLDNKYSSIRDHLNPYDEQMMEMFEQAWKEYKQFIHILKGIRADQK